MRMLSVSSVPRLPSHAQRCQRILSRLSRVAPLVLAAASLACEGSSNPVSPSATNGQLAGDGTRDTLAVSGLATDEEVSLKVTKPVVESPSPGGEVDTLTPTLTIRDAQTRYVSGVSLNHEFQVFRTGTGGGETVHDAGVVGPAGGTTSYVVQTALSNNTVYHWRARAAHAGEYGPWSDVAMLRTNAPDRILLPELTLPEPGAALNSIRPILEVANPVIEGKPGTVSVEFEVATDAGFDTKIAVLYEELGKHAGIDTVFTGAPQTALPRDRRTSTQLTIDLEVGGTYFWRARGTNGNATSPGTIVGEFTAARFFTVTSNTAAATGGGGGGGGGGPTVAGTAEDRIDLSQVVWLHTNVSSWPQTSTITSTQVGAPPICINHTKVGQWQAGDFSGSGASVDSNVWVFANINGTWYAATWEWLRAGTTCKNLGASDFKTHVNGAAPLSSWTPKSGDQIGLMVSTPARLGVPAGRERTNVVLVTWP